MISLPEEGDIGKWASERRLASMNNAQNDQSKPKSTTELRRESRLARIAKALASGATVTDIAEAEGIGRTIASRDANSPECRQLIAEFVNAEHDEMHAMFYRGLRVIEHAYSARGEYMTKDGRIMDGGPDHYARLAATKHFRDFVGAGRPVPKQPEKQQRGYMTLYQLDQLIKASENPDTDWNTVIPPSYDAYDNCRKLPSCTLRASSSIATAAAPRSRQRKTLS